MSTIRNRVIERRRMDAAEIELHAGNWRLHPEEQRQAMGEVLDQIGQVGELYAYYSARNNGALTLIDGHLRKGLGGEWDVAITDLNDQEADKLLLLYDPLSAAAGVDQAKLDELMAQVEVDSPAILALLETMKPADTGDSGDSGSPAEAETFRVVIDCDSQSEQAELVERFTQDGWKCRAG